MGDPERDRGRLVLTNDDVAGDERPDVCQERGQRRRVGLVGERRER